MDSADDWTGEATRLSALCDDTLKAIRARDRSLRIGSDASASVGVISRNLQVLNADVPALEKRLSQLEQDRSVSSDELRRRETVVIDLLSFRDRLESLATNSNPHRNGGGRSVRFAEDVVVLASNASDGGGSEQLLDMQRRGLEQQDSHLDALAHVVGQQKQLAHQIGDELDLQAELLDDLDEGVQRSQSFLNRAAKTLNKVTRSAGSDRSTQLVCSLVLIIVAIVAVVVIVKLLN